MTTTRERAEELANELPLNKIQFKSSVDLIESALIAVKNEALEEAAKSVDSYRVIDKYIAVYEAQSFLLNAAAFIRGFKSLGGSDDVR